MPIHVRAIPQAGQPLPYPNIITTISSRPAFSGHCAQPGPRYPWGVVPSVLPAGDVGHGPLCRLALPPTGMPGAPCR